MRTFGLTTALLPTLLQAPAYWAGDQIVINTPESKDYKKLSQSRLFKVREFVDAEEFDSSVFKAALSSIPRWRYDREIQNVKTPDAHQSDAGIDYTADSDDEFKFVSVGKDIRGIARAHRAFLGETRRIFRSENALVEFLINRESDSYSLRLEVWRSIAC